MKTKFLVFVAFVVYYLFVISAFQENTPHLFDAKIAFKMQSDGIIDDIRELGWNGHYIWRFISCLLVSALVGFLAGGASQSAGGRVAAFSNAIVQLIYLLLLGYLVSAGYEFPESSSFIITAIVAIPVTTYIAFKTGNIGEEIQKEYGNDTIFGVKPYHYIWAVFPIYWYGLGIVYVITKFIGIQFITLRDLSIIGSIVDLLAFIPVFAWIFPLVIVYKILSGRMYQDKSRLVLLFINTGILIVGAVVAILIQYGAFLAISKFAAI